MKSPVSRHRLWLPCLVFPILISGCTEQEGQINSLKDSISRLRETNNTGTIELQKMTQQLATVNQQVSRDASKRKEFEEKSQKSAATERMIIKYRTELEESLDKFTASVADYRKQYLP